MILHIVSPSPFTDTSLQRSFELAGPGDAILLIGDATLALSNPALCLSERSEGPALFVLEEDRQARGLSLPDSPPVTPVSYDGFVELATRFDKTLSWF